MFILVIILSLLVAAAVSNPSREKFINWGAAEIKNQTENDLERIFKGAAAVPVLEMQTKVSDYVFFSIFTLEKSDSKIRYLGIFDNFFGLD